VSGLLATSPVPGGGLEPGALEQHLRARRASGAKLLVPYLMAGMTPDWLATLEAVVAAGADAVEVGIPFSDPVMDGPVIQDAALASLAAGTTPESVLAALGEADIDVPLAVMTYYNLIFRAGHRRMEELGPWAEEAGDAGVETVLLVAPSTSEARTAAICARSRGFVYAVARMGITGERADIGDAAAEVVAKIRRATDTPALVGVGVSTPEQATAVCAHADGVVVGSALVRRLLAGEGPEGAARFVGELRSAIDDG
jgi:tryptophan synthase alpha chain